MILLINLIKSTKKSLTNGVSSNYILVYWFYVNLYDGKNGKDSSV